MVWVNTILNNFVSGEVSSDLYGRYDLPIYNKACEILQNFIVKDQGPAYFRPGFKFVNRVAGNSEAVLKKFVFNDDVAYVLEFSHLKLRFYKNQLPILETGKNISALTISTEMALTATAHGYEDGDELFLYDVAGLEELNGRNFIVSDKTTDTFKLKDLWGDYVSSVGKTYTGGGSAERVYALTTTYDSADDLTKLQVAQNADTMYIVHPSYQPRVLTRAGDANWAIATVTNSGFGSGTKTGTNFPFTSAGNYPRAVAFAQGRLWYGGTDNAVDKFWGSRAPDSAGAVRYDDFTTGADATYAIVFILNPPSGKVEAIEWISANDRYLLIGTYGGVSKVTGSQDDEAVTPSSVNVRQLASSGVYPTFPVPLGSRVYYLQRSGLILRELKYELAADSLIPHDRNLISREITGDGMIQIVYSEGRPEVLWGIRNDGVLLGLTNNDSEAVSGWHKHPIGGNAKVKSLTTIPRAGLDDQLWAIIERTINGTAVRYVEYLTDEVVFPKLIDFYETGDNEADDLLNFNNVIFNRQREYKYLDSNVTFDGSDRSYVADATLTIVEEGGEATLTTDEDIFTSDDVGREVWGGYNDLTGAGGGRYLITEYTSAQEVTAEILAPQDDDVNHVSGTWFITTDTITGLDHLEGSTVQVVADGGTHIDCIVSAGGITLDAQHSMVHVGFGYRGILKTLNLEAGGINGPAQTKRKRITDLRLRFHNTLGAVVGTDIYDMEPILYTNTSQVLGRPATPVSGFKYVTINDNWVGKNFDDVSTHLIVLQDYPLPCTIQFIDANMEVTNE